MRRARAGQAADSRQDGRRAECLNRGVHIGLIAPPWTPVPPPLYGGIELVVDELARGFADAGHDVTLFTTGDSTCAVPKLFVLEEAEGARIGAAVPELRHVIGAYHALADCDVIHDHTLAGPLLAAARSDLPPVVTTVHGPLNEDLIALYSELAGKVPVLAISETQRRAAPEVEIAGSSTTASTRATSRSATAWATTTAPTASSSAG